MVGLIGRNGTGKTTLLRTLLGFLTPHEGEVRASCTTGYVPQQSQIAFPFTTRQVTAMGRARHVGLFGSLSRADWRAVDAALERTGLAPLASMSFFELSGGERQLALIARSLASGCGALVLDEPFSDLDLDNQARTLGILRDLAAHQGMAVLYSTHQPDHLFAGSSATLALSSGGGHALGPTGALLTDAFLSEVYRTDVRIVDVERPAATTRHAAAHFGNGSPCPLQTLTPPASARGQRNGAPHEDAKP